MTHYLLDTNICIYIINKRPPEVFERFRRIKLNQLHIPTIVISELYFGLEKNQSHKRNTPFLENFIAPLSVTGFSIEAAKQAAIICYRFRKQGTPIGAYDIQIAAVAMAEEMVLLTSNTEAFERIDGLQMENRLQ
jgi:tRNA(fMet)-specific endonuclease VapC